MKPLLLLLAVVLMFPATATAGWKQDRALEIARYVWRDGGPCVQRATIRFARVIPPGAEHGQAWADELNCVIGMPAGKRYSWGAFCAYVLHEMGHLAGYRDAGNTTDPLHSRNPNSIMFPEMWLVENRLRRRGRWVTVVDTDPRCRDNGRDYLRRIR